MPIASYSQIPVPLPVSIMSDIISISNASTSSDGKVYYHISLKLPLRSFTITKRYSEFDDLVNKLCIDLGINNQDFPYVLPPKTGVFSFTSSKSQAIINDRKQKLSQFLNSLIRDKDLQNNSIVHNFLQLPTNFTFTDTLFRSTSDEKAGYERDLIIDDESLVNHFKWLEILRLFKYTINEMSKNYDHSIQLKITTRDKVNKLIKPNLSKLLHRLTTLHKQREIDSNEYNRRLVLLKEVENELSSLQDNLLSQSSYTSSKNPDSLGSKHDLLNGATQSKRIFGKSDTPRETNDTIALGNKELLQYQQQIHKEQDQEIESLRKIVARQRQLGESINTEVQEQNQLLDMFADEVDQSTDKLKYARNKARNIA